MAIKHLPQMVKIGKAWVIEDFYPTKGAVYWNQVGKKTSTLYVIECAGFCKIGYASNFQSRFISLDGANPLQLTTVATRSVPEASIAYVEAWMHQEFADRRTKGEWFSVPPSEILAVLPEAVRRGRAYARYCRRWYEENERSKRTPEAQAWARAQYIEMLERHKKEMTYSLEKVERNLNEILEVA